MHKPKIDLLKEKYDIGAPKKTPLLFFGRTLTIIIGIIVTTGMIFSYQVNTSADNSNFPNFSLVGTIKHLVSSNERALDGEDDDRVNILLTGVGGAGHDGPQLTDTIIFTSIKPSTNEIAMMSLPRDMTVPIPGYGYRKVNHANAYGEMEKYGYGPELATEVIGDVLDEEIQYYLRVDFSGFAEFIDAIGGIDVYVDQTFTDPNYPSHGKEDDMCGYEEIVEEEEEVSETVSELAAILEIDTEEKGILEITAEAENAPEVVPNYSCRFESITFYEGWTHLDGDTSLKFARSRHGNNGEGSDFARSRRQQKIILAVKDKVLSASTFLNPTRISRMLETLEDNIATNLDVWELVRLAKTFKDLDTSNITHHVIDASVDSPLYATVLNGAYVLLPKNDDWSVLQGITDDIFNPEAGSVNQFANVPDDKPLFVKVEIQNGTNITGLAFKTSQLLDGQGFDIIKIGNAVTRDFEHTVIYDLTDGQRSDELKALRDYLQADVTMTATGWMISGDIVPKGISVSSDDHADLTTENNVDFLIILGQNASSLARN
ncbi:LCP family protein [Candidatus Uhrbacteria bacterium]|jgi:polyisoprenyl-teichoic acid--peptidoglycan teichoic acid transferase|nr:LCP family protein [Candidatus Uhrbacteria bacterium]